MAMPIRRTSANLKQQLISRHVLATRRFTESHGVVEASGDE
jgi:hypothetical protein